MNKEKTGVQAIGIKLPIMRSGDNLIETVVNCLMDSTDGDFEDKSILGITESLVGRCYKMYVTVQDIADETEKFFGKDAEVWMTNAIYSRNRHSLILRGIARACSRINFLATKEDSRGNLWGVNPFTNVSIPDFYKQICTEENCEFVVYDAEENPEIDPGAKVIDCSLHRKMHHCDIKAKCPNYYFLTDYCNDKNPDFGLLGTNKANDENGGTLKLFPSKVLGQKVCDEVKAKIKEKTGRDIVVCIYADGCFHSPFLYDSNGNVIPGTSINEFADPVTMPAYTDKALMESTPNEIKLKYFADKGYSDEEIQQAISNSKQDLKGSMASQGTTPRKYTDLLASLMDLMSGSGSRATPCILIQNYFAI